MREKFSHYSSTLKTNISTLSFLKNLIDYANDSSVINQEGVFRRGCTMNRLKEIKVIRVKCIDKFE